MPYIKSDDGRRKALQNGDKAKTAGELNYQIFHYFKYNIEDDCLTLKQCIAIEAYVNNFLGTTPNYQRYNDMSGCLLRCKREIERRLKKDASYLIYIMNAYDDEINEYEDIKIVENGDV